MNDEDDQFLLTSRLEIQSLLRSIEEKKALLRMHVADRTVAIITTILEVDPAGSTFIVDDSADEGFNRRISDAEKVLFETNLDKVRIQFSVQKITACLQDGRPALRAPFPESIRRVQRREYYRVEVPVTEPAWCTIPMPEGKSIKLEIKDISAGGISVLDKSHLLDTSEEMLYKDCRLELPDAGTVVANLQIKRSRQETLSNDKKVHMLGCRFHDLSNPMHFTVQQYIGKLERKLNAKRRGFE